MVVFPSKHLGSVRFRCTADHPSCGNMRTRAVREGDSCGFTRDMPLERYVRDARILRIYEGSSEIQRTIIARGVLG